MQDSLNYGNKPVANLKDRVTTERVPTEPCIKTPDAVNNKSCGPVEKMDNPQGVVAEEDVVNYDEIDRIININYNLPMGQELLKRSNNKKDAIYKKDKTEVVRPVELPREYRANTYERVGRMSLETIEDILHGNRKAIPM